MDYCYIADHINRIETRFKDIPDLQQDSMWRIASSANLFPLNSDKLSSEQIEQVIGFINKFKDSEDGKQAVEACKRLQRSHLPTTTICRKLLAKEFGN